jgi:hypothetical protein
MLYDAKKRLQQVNNCVSALVFCGNYNFETEYYINKI